MCDVLGESSPFVVELVTFLPLLYLSLCTYRSLFKFRLFGDFCLKVSRIHTYIHLYIHVYAGVEIQIITLRSLPFGPHAPHKPFLPSPQNPIL